MPLTALLTAGVPLQTFCKRLLCGGGIPDGGIGGCIGSFMGRCTQFPITALFSNGGPLNRVGGGKTLPRGALCCQPKRFDNRRIYT